MLECFVDIEIERALPFPDTVVQADIYPVFEFPAVTDAVRGKGFAPLEFFHFWEYIPGSRPDSYAVAVVYFLP